VKKAKTMKLELSQGCICDSLEIDNTEENDLTDEQRRNVIDKVCTYLKSKPELLNPFLTWFLTWEGEYEDLGTCETCGDHVDRYTLEIED